MNNPIIRFSPLRISNSETQSIDYKQDKFYTIDDAISYIGSGWFQYRLLFLTGMIVAADAMEMMLLSFLLPKLKNEWNLQPPWDGSIGAIVFVGMLLGLFIIFYFY